MKPKPGRSASSKEIAEKQLREKVNLENLYRFQTELTQREAISKKEERQAYLARNRYLSIILLGKISGLFVMKFVEANKKNQDAFIEEQVRRISRGKKCSAERSGRHPCRIRFRAGKKGSPKARESCTKTCVEPAGTAGHRKK